MNNFSPSKLVETWSALLNNKSLIIINDIILYYENKQIN